MNTRINSIMNLSVQILCDIAFVDFDIHICFLTLINFQNMSLKLKSYGD